ncbi:L-type lectin-domain containing receptor kinase IX.1-like [Phragmites australis]|uniref:L-type lectin-domain containing receptor kinase IX.1-like n=1 Tax=Phragmites australis TaxID=29695 RepID=UPI002D76E987|nr:L-type lectin-domain containing receptor kinase IX.1-like [Phragmites australis]
MTKRVDDERGGPTASVESRPSAYAQAAESIREDLIRMERAHALAPRMANSRAAAMGPTTRLLVLSLIYFLLVASHGALRADSLSFDFDFSNPSTFNLTDFTPAGDAAFHGRFFDLTNNSYRDGIASSVGRMAYAHPVPLRDNATGQVASFTTTFSFAIDITDRDNKGDGMAFFLSQYPSVLPPNSGGGALGLCKNCDNNKTAGEDRFVAVEFDTYNNTWDPSATYDHMGINVNSIVSVANISLESFSLSGQMTARVDYNGSTGVMNVELQFPPSPRFYGATRTFNFSAKVDLMTVLPEQVAIGFSAANGASVELHQLLAWSFSSVTPGSSSSTATSTGAPPSSSSRIGLKVALGITSSVSLFLCIAVLALLRALRRKNLTLAEIQLESEARNKLMDQEFEKGSGPKRFEYGQLAIATRDFSEEEKLGEGGFGAVYRGFLKELDLHVAIKRVSRGSGQGRKEYTSEVKIISRLRHRNLVQLIGWCHEGRELLLVYELMPNGSLDTHLYNPTVLLTWPVRFKIVLGLGSALLYLHQDWEQCVVHRDVKPSNIMLDASFGAKLGDFGLARLFDHGRGSHTTNLAGTMGYMDPNCFLTGRADPESDVYSFGVVLLEIACGRPPVVPDQEDQGRTRLVEWVWGLYGRRAVLEAADERMGGDFDADEVGHVLVVGLACAHPDCNLRPSIRQAMSMLQCEATLPTLPEKMPTPKYI